MGGVLLLLRRETVPRAPRAGGGAYLRTMACSCQVNLSIPLPRLTDPTQQCYFVRVKFKVPATINQVTDDAGNVYAQSVASAGINYGYFALNAKSASQLRVVYAGGAGFGRIEEDVCDIRAWKVSGIAPSQLRGLNVSPSC